MPDARDIVFQARELTKFYGKARGIESVSLQIERGEMFGLLGPNGAGKTTLIRSALGFLTPTSGWVGLFGDAVHIASDRHHERVGYLPADLRLWRGLTARRASDLMLALGTRNPRTDKRDEIARRLDLDLDRKVRTLSLGNRQKVGLMLALQHEPELLFLDEPTSGLDPLVRRVVTAMLREFIAGGGTVIYSSHNLGEVEEICTRVGILRKGRLVTLKTIEEIRAEREQRLEFTFAEGAALPGELPAEMAGFTLCKNSGRTWEVSFSGSPDALIAWLAQFSLDELTAKQITLEEAFLAYYREDNEILEEADTETVTKD